MTAGVIVPETGSKRLTRLIKEISIGQTPAGNWSQLRNTGGDGAGSTVNTTASNELSGSGALGQRDQIVTGRDGTFSYDAEISKDTPFELMFESLLQNEFTANQLVPGEQDVTFTIEDELLSVKEFEYVRGARCNTFSMTINANEIITANFAGAGTDPDIVDGPSASGVSLSGQEITDATNAGSLVVGDFAQLTNAADASDNGYYRITAINGSDITVDIVGSFAGASADVEYTGKSLSDGQVTDPKGSNTPMSAGSTVDLELSEDGGTTWFDSLVYGWRVPTLTLNVATEVSDLREITEDAAYVQLPVNRPITTQFQWHVVNLQPLRWLRDDVEFGLRVRVSDPASNFYLFTMPRCKFAEGSKGPAANGQEMAGTSTLNALLDSNDINIQINRNA